MFRDNNATKLKVWERSHLVISLDGIFCFIGYVDRCQKRYLNCGENISRLQVIFQRTQRETQHFAVLCLT